MLSLLSCLEEGEDKDDEDEPSTKQGKLWISPTFGNVTQALKLAVTMVFFNQAFKLAVFMAEVKFKLVLPISNVLVSSKHSILELLLSFHFKKEGYGHVILLVSKGGQIPFLNISLVKERTKVHLGHHSSRSCQLSALEAAKVTFQTENSILLEWMMFFSVVKAQTEVEVLKLKKFIFDASFHLMEANPKWRHTGKHGKGFVVDKPRHEVSFLTHATTMDGNREVIPLALLDSVFLQVLDSSSRGEEIFEDMEGVLPHVDALKSFCFSSTNVIKSSMETQDDMVRNGGSFVVRSLHDTIVNSKEAGEDGFLSSGARNDKVRLIGASSVKDPMDNHFSLCPKDIEGAADNKGMLFPRQQKRDLFPGFMAGHEVTFILHVIRRFFFQLPDNGEGPTDINPSLLSRQRNHYSLCSISTDCKRKENPHGRWDFLKNHSLFYGKDVKRDFGPFQLMVFCLPDNDDYPKRRVLPLLIPTALFGNSVLDLQSPGPFQGLLDHDMVFFDGNNCKQNNGWQLHNQNRNKRSACLYLLFHVSKLYLGLEIGIQ